MSGTVQALTKSLIFSKSKEVWIFFLHSSTFDPTIFGSESIFIFFFPVQLSSFLYFLNYLPQLII